MGINFLKFIILTIIITKTILLLRYFDLSIIFSQNILIRNLNEAPNKIIIRREILDRCPFKPYIHDFNYFSSENAYYKIPGDFSVIYFIYFRIILFKL